MNVAAVLAGIAIATFAASGVFFFKFWTASRDRFYMLFAASCGLLALERIVLMSLSSAQNGVRSELTEAVSWVYLIRLLAFIIILIAVIDKNKRSNRI